MTRHYSDLGSAFDWLKQISLAEPPIRSTTQVWIEHVISMEFLVFVPQMWFGGETSHGVAKYRLFSRATILIRVPNKDSALADMFQEPSYAAEDSDLVSSFPFTRDGFFRLKSIRISISPRNCWFLSKVHEACELGIVSLSRLYPKKQLPQRHAHFWIFS